MSYTIISKMKIDLKTLTVKATMASSNIRTWNDKLIHEDVEYSCSTIEELRDLVLGFANGIINGTYRLPRSHQLSKKIAYLKDNGEINPIRELSLLKEVNDNEENVKILTGETKVKIGVWKIQNSSGTLYFKENKRSIALVGNGKSHSSYYSLVDAEAGLALASTNGWKDKYSLTIVRVK